MIEFSLLSMGIPTGRYSGLCVLKEGTPWKNETAIELWLSISFFQPRPALQFLPTLPNRVEMNCSGSIR